MSNSPLLVTKRDPLEEGEWETGCFTHASNNMALCCMSNGDLYKDIDRLYKKWDKHLTQFASKPGNLDKIKTEGLRWLLENAAELYGNTKEYVNKHCMPEDVVETLPDEDRDWFCWLYRHFRSLKQDEENNK